MNLTCKEHSMLAQLRMGILPLNIETGRYKKVISESDTESFKKMSKYEKLAYLCEHFPRQVAKYICHAFSKRQLYMYTN